MIKRNKSYIISLKEKRRTAMADIIMWVTIGVFALFLIIGLIGGLVRGLKRSSLHLLFLVVSVVVAFFITKPITNAILGIQLNIDGQSQTISQFIISSIQSNFDISQFETATTFLEQLPNAIVSPIMFILLTLVVFLIFDIIYLIVARLAFGKKKNDFAKAKPYRAYGGLIGIVEGFVFVFLLFAPLTSLTKTYQQIVELPTTETQITMLAEGDTQGGQQTSQKLPSIAEALSDILPPEVNEAIFAYNDSVIGKIAGAGGLDNALFDGLSNFELDGEKIEIRKEILDSTQIYDDFVVVYNEVIDNNFKNINLTELKASIEKFINNGLFKTVISDTLNDFVVKFDSLKDQLNLQDLPEMVQEIVNDLYERFSSEGFDTYEYLRHDILSVLDVADEVLQSDLISQFEGINPDSENRLADILTIIDTNSEVVKSIANNALNLNLVNDTFETLGSYASQMLSDQFANDQGLEIGLNTSISDKSQLIDQLLQTVDDFLNINNMVDIGAMMEAENVVEYLAGIDDLDNVLTQLGTTLDNVRNLEIFVLPQNETRPETVYVLDNILTLYNFNLLGDEVYENPTDETPITLDTYSKFVDFIKTPVLELQNLGLTNIGADMNFDELLSAVLTGLEENENLLSDMLLPIYQLNAMKLNELFDQLISQLGSEENTNGMFSFDKVKEEASSAEKNGVAVWDRELGYLGQVLLSLNKGEVGTENETYLSALLSGSANMEEILNDMIANNTLADTLDPVFSATAFEGLTSQIFDSIDSAIESITKVKPETKLDNLKVTKEDVIDTIQEILGTINTEGDLTLQQLGSVLDTLKTNAYNGGAKDGVFNEIFANLIWYITGDKIVDNASYDVAPENDFYKDVKGYLGVEGDGYYTVESYEDIMAELDQVVNFATTLSSNLSGIELSLETAQQFVQAIQTSIDSLAGTDETNAQMLANVKNLLDGNPEREELFDTAEIAQYRDAISSAIDQVFEDATQTAQALKTLLEIA